MERLPFRPALVAATVSLLVLLVAACGSSSSEPQKPAEIKQFRAFLEESSENLVRMTGRLLAKVEAGDQPRAGSRYASARVFYGQMQPAAAMLDLDTRIDARAIDVPADEFGGFHRIEKALFADGTTAGMTPVARQLLADIEELQRKARSSRFETAQIAASANDLLQEIATETIEGKEELYAHIDLIDVAARIEGAEAAFKALKPPLASEDADLTEEIEDGFAKSYASLKPWGPAAREPDQPRPQEPGIAFVIHDELSDEVIDEIARPIRALAETFSEVPEKVSDE